MWWRAAPQLLRFVGPGFCVTPPLNAPPTRCGVVFVVLRQAELALEQRGAAAGVDHPARGQRRLRAVALEHDQVRVVTFAQFDRAHGGGVAEIDAERECTLAEEFLEAAGVDLPRRRRQLGRGSRRERVCQYG